MVCRVTKSELPPHTEMLEMVPDFVGEDEAEEEEEADAMAYLPIRYVLVPPGQN